MRLLLAVNRRLAVGLIVACWCAPAVAGERYFQVELRSGVWWLVDPAGKPFFSLGVNVVSPGPGREHYDKARPQYAAWRYYGDTNAWSEAAIARLKEWNFNTIGAWQDKSLQKGPLPYTVVLHLGADQGVPWNDLFADSFAQRMDELAERAVASRRDDPLLLGWFTDNELAWYPDQLFTFQLGQSIESRTRTRLVRLLRDDYGGDFAALARDFAASEGVESFDQLDRGGTLKLRPGGQGERVIAKFTLMAADQYYHVVCEAIRKHDPHHLILGDRYAGHCPDEVAEAAGCYVDVVSTNYDWPAGVDGYLPHFYLRRLHEKSGRPVMVSEYYAAATENQSGNPNSGGLFVVVPSQTDRTSVVRGRLRMFADEPFVVGAHWFQFTDEPPGGRSHDGEDYNFGLVDIENQPYKQLTEAMQQMQGEAPVQHGKSAARAAPAEESRPAIDVQPLAAGTKLEEVDRSLRTQAMVIPQGGGGLADLSVAWDAANLYLSLAGNHLVFDDAYAEIPPPLGDGLVLHLSVGEGSAQSAVELKMLGERAELTAGKAPFVHWQRGVRFGATVAIPGELAGRKTWAAGDRVNLHADLADLRSSTVTRWDANLVLSNRAEDEIAAKDVGLGRKNVDQ